MDGRRVQFHLGTAILMSIAAALLLYANVGRMYERAGGPSGMFEVYGWPMDFERYIHFDEKGPDQWQWANWANEFTIAISVNVVVAGTLLLGIAALSEWIIRRRQVTSAEREQ